MSSTVLRFVEWCSWPFLITVSLQVKWIFTISGTLDERSSQTWGVHSQSSTAVPNCLMVAAHFTDLGRMVAWVKPACSGSWTQTISHERRWPWTLGHTDRRIVNCIFWNLNFCVFGSRCLSMLVARLFYWICVPQTTSKNNDATASVPLNNTWNWPVGLPERTANLKNGVRFPEDA